MNCKGCQEKFNGSDRRPLILIKCGHSMCQMCIEKAQEQHSDTQDAYSNANAKNLLISQNPPNGAQFLGSGVKPTA